MMKMNRTKTIILSLICAFALVPLFAVGTAFAEDEEEPDNGIPVVYLNIDETDVTIKQMNDSPDHSVFCIGTISIDVPVGFHYSDFPNLKYKSSGRS